MIAAEIESCPQPAQSVETATGLDPDAPQVGIPPLAPGAALAATALATAVGRAMAHAGRERWGASLPALAVGLGLLVLAMGLTAVGAAGVTAAEIGVVWLVGLLAPGLALALTLTLRSKDGLIELTRSLDRAGGVRITRWLPRAIRWVTPTVLAVSVSAGVLTLWRDGLPGRAVAEGLGQLGPLTGALHTVVPALVLALLFALSTGLSWIPGRSVGDPR